MNIDNLEKYFNNDDQKLLLDENLVSSFSEKIKLLLMYDYEKPNYTKEELSSLYKEIETIFKNILKELDEHDDNKLIVFMNSLPEIRRTLNTSIDAIMEGDPASISKQQIVLYYPGFEAILYYRVAHQLYVQKMPLLARYISELAHRHTGIDINPGAVIGDYFFIDHGTGIVIGETTIIGNHVKIYQGVTLGALSLSKGRELVGVKRHPTVEDYVTIYSNAAIFGGNTIIGEHSTIGGDVYLTHSVEANSIVCQTDKDLNIKKK